MDQNYEVGYVTRSPRLMRLPVIVVGINLILLFNSVRVN